MGSKRQKNLDLDPRIIAAIQAERLTGISMNKSVEAAVYWYVNRLGPHERELARVEAQTWIDTGILPDSALANELDELLRNAKAQHLQQLAEKPRASGKRKRG